MITIGSRKSKLAMWQTETVAAILEASGLKTQINSMETIGDKVLDTSIAKIGSKGVFTVELEEQLAAGITDIAVHSAKDMQSRLPNGFSLIAFSEREKACDVLVSRKKDLDLEDPDQMLTVGTSSVRRRAFLRRSYPHLNIVEMRGNLQTRIKKMDDGDCDALMLAYAGVKRMGYEDMIVKEFDPDHFIPPVGQGCIAIEAADTLAREKREEIRSCINNRESEICLLAERAFLQELEGGCSIPAFGRAVLKGDKLVLKAGLSSLDGSRVIDFCEEGSAEDPEKLGRRAGITILEKGGKEMLEEIRRIQAEQ